jgi:hypothetical protein
MAYHVIACHVISCHYMSFHVLLEFSNQLLIKSVGLVNAEYRGSEIPPHVYPAQREIRAGFHCLSSIQQFW